MKERFSKLLTVKSIVTLALTIVFCVLALRGTISGAEFLTIFTIVVGFYFGTQHERKVSEGIIVEGLAEIAPASQEAEK